MIRLILINIQTTFFILGMLQTRKPPLRQYQLEENVMYTQKMTYIPNNKNSFCLCISIFVFFHKLAYILYFLYADFWVKTTTGRDEGSMKKKKKKR